MTTLALTRSRSFEPLRMIDQAAHLAESTRNQYRKALARYLETGASLADAEALADYARSLPSSSRSFLKASVKLVTDRLSNGIKSVATPQNVDAVQAALFRIESMQNAIETRQQKGTKAHTWLSKSQVKALLDTCGNDLRGQRDRLVLALLAGAGLRRAEAASLTFADVKRQPIGDRVRTVLEVQGKGAKSRVVPISDALADLIAEWSQAARISEGRVLRSFDKRGAVRDSLTGAAVFRIVREHGAMIGLPDLAPHDLRRTYAQLGFEAGVPITQISRLLGHSDVKTTQRYLNLDLDLETTASDFVPV